MSLFNVDRTRCVKCGLCVAVCPRGLIQLPKDGWPCTTKSALCVACGHCVAVCPKAALDNCRSPRSNQLPAPNGPAIPEDTIRLWLRSRRSIRRFQSRAVSRNLLRQWLDVARFAPSGGNSQGISYLVIDQPSTLRQLTACTIAWMEEPAQIQSPNSSVYAQYVAMYRQNGQDSILRDAPVLVLGTAAKKFARGRENTLLSLEYAEFYAPALGLGTCWAGLLEAAAFSGYSSLLELLRLPADKQLTGAMMVGFPAVVFHRLVDRNPLDIDFWES